MVVEERFELSVDLHLHNLSKVAPSATRTLDHVSKSVIVPKKVYLSQSIEKHL